MSHSISSYLLIWLLSVSSILSAAIPHGFQIKRRAWQIDDHYDYIIAGGGTAGLTVADRLTAAYPDRSVLVVEYGELSNLTSILQPAAGIFNLQLAFNIQSQPQAALHDRTYQVTVGKVVGGSSAINAQMFDRGSKADYDAWGAVSAPFTDEYNKAGWNWDGILPYFKKSVTFDIPSQQSTEAYGYTYDVDAAYGGKGPIHATYPPFQWPSRKVIWDAWTELGVKPQKEAQGGDAYGLFWFPSSQDARTQTRSYARTGHYNPIANRTNLHLLVSNKVSRIVLDGDSSNLKAKGVTIQSVTSNSTFTVRAEREVILSAGAIHTPHILQRSGIGPKDILKAAGIDLKLDLPGVGQNFQDHALAGLFNNLTTDMEPSPMSMYLNQTLMQEAQRQYQQNRTGPLTLSGGNSGAFLPLSTVAQNSSSAILSAASAQSPSAYLLNTTHPTVLAGYRSQHQVLQSLLKSDKAALIEYPITPMGAGMAVLLKPLSRGSVNIDPKNIDGEPLVDYRTFSNPIDVDTLLHGVKTARRLNTTPSMKKLGPVEIFPGDAVKTDEDIKAWLVDNVSPSFYHPVGTAVLMPKEAGGVVAPDLKVHGLSNVRVVDASVMPLIPGTHTSSTVYAVAEKAADIIIKSTA